MFSRKKFFTKNKKIAIFNEKMMISLLLLMN